jgi:2'-5' RNA ligase
LSGSDTRSTRPATARVFFALWPAPTLAARLAAIANDAARQFGGRPSREETLHLTLAFLGNVPEARLPELCALAKAVPFEPFTLTLDELGFWPRQQLLWAGCRSRPDVLSALIASLHASLTAAGFLSPNRQGETPPRFTPHVTLLRKTARNAALSLPLVEAMPWPCQQFVLVRSRLTDTGPSYETIARFDGRS